MATVKTFTINLILVIYLFKFKKVLEKDFSKIFEAKVLSYNWVKSQIVVEMFQFF